MPEAPNVQRSLTLTLKPLAQVEHAPNVQMHKTPDASKFDITANSEDDEYEADVWAADMRPSRHRRRHLAE